MPRHLILRLEAPLMAFGAEAVDNRGVIRDFPARSLVTGLLANALGYQRGEADKHERLQERLRLALRIDRPGERISDFQTAELVGNERGWTTAGRPEGRAGGAGTYKGPHLRYRDYVADACLCVALTLEQAEESPTLTDLATALEMPARPLFLGRKPCLPAEPLYESEAEAATPLEALKVYPLRPSGAHGQEPRDLTVFWSEGEGDLPQAERLHATTRRNWANDVHAGVEVICRGVIRMEAVGDKA